MQKKPYPLEKTTERGIYKRGGRYVVVFRDPAGRQRKRFARTFAEARDLKAKLRADIRRGEWREDERSGDLSFEQYAREWCDTYKGRTQRGVREHTLNDYRARLELDAIPFFGSRPLAGIGPRDVKKFIAHVESRGVSYNTVRLASAPVRALFATAFEDELITRNPTLGVRITRPEELDENGDGEEDAKALTAEELGKLLEATAPEWRLLFEFLAHTGLRVGEAFGLRWGDIKGQRLKVQRRFYRGDFAPPKSKYGKRTVPLTEGMARKLWEYRKTTQYAKDDDLVFPARDGGPLNYSNVLRRGLRPAATKAGVPWAAFHTLRHTCASNLFRNGWNAKQVQLVLGHHSPAFTLATYVHLLPEDLPTPDFLDTLTGGQQWATRATETGRDEQEGQEAVYAAVQG